jgi:hypothetical protein
VNTGDWVESCTAAVEHFDGRLEILHHFPAGAHRIARKEPARPHREPAREAA